MDVPGEVHSERAVRVTLGPLSLLRRLRVSPPPVAGVIFDFCGVLYDDSAWQRWLLRLVTLMGLHTHYVPFFRLWRCAYLDRVRRHELDYWTALRQFLGAAGLTPGQIDEVEAAAHPRWFDLQECVFALPGVVRTLRALTEQNVRLGLACSDPLDQHTIRRRLERLQLEDTFAWIQPAIELDDSERDLLPQAVRQMRLPASSLAYVGRDAFWLRAAERIGLRSVAFNHDEDATAQVYLNSFPELLGQFSWNASHARAG